MSESRAVVAEPHEQAHVQTDQPFAASWVDRLNRRLGRLPYPMAAYLAIWVVQIAVVHAVAWYAGVVPPGHIDLRIVLVASWTPYSLGFVAYLDHAATAALAAFRPAMNLDEAQFARLRYEFTTLPARPVIGWNLLGLVLSVTSILMVPDVAGELLAVPVAAVVNIGLAATGMAVAAVSIYQTLRQLRLVRRTYREAARLNLFQSTQLYAFSTLTLRTGVGWLFIIYAGAALFPALLRNAVWTGVSVLLLVTITTSLVSTLLDIHRRIQMEKSSHMAAVSKHLEDSFTALHDHILDQRAANLPELREIMQSLELERSILAKIPTWPWQPGTLASFLTALLLPLLIWLGQQVLQRLVRL